MSYAESQGSWRHDPRGEDSVWGVMSRGGADKGLHIKAVDTQRGGTTLGLRAEPGALYLLVHMFKI